MGIIFTKIIKKSFYLKTFCINVLLTNLNVNYLIKEIIYKGKQNLIVSFLSNLDRLIDERNEIYYENLPPISRCGSNLNIYIMKMLSSCEKKHSINRSDSIIVQADLDFSFLQLKFISCPPSITDVMH